MGGRQFRVIEPERAREGEADSSLVAENRRVIERIRATYQSVDTFDPEAADRLSALTETLLHRARTVDAQS
ncbi:hypothetical protein ACWZHB_03355 [Nocardia sp. FBN12]|uniref:hypothetical protein n=1 Tax=Nocardia sp. FBN12 TaxID=3419766 RepID=UPI003D0090C5